MQKIFLLALFSAGTGLTQAQSIPAGTISLGGSIGYSRNTSTNTSFVGSNLYKNELTDSQFRLAPSVGYFIADNLAVGLSTSYRAGRISLNSSVPGFINPPKLKASSAFTVGPYVQYYTMLTEQFGLVGTLGVGYQSTYSPNYVDPGFTIISEVKGRGYYANLTPGIIFFPVSKLGISATMGQLGFEKLTNKRVGEPDESKSTFSSFGANFGLNQLNFGGTYFFGR